MKPKRLNLNKWTRVETEDATEGYDTLIITPQRYVDGTQPPELYFKRGEPLIPDITDTDNSVWYKDCHISKQGSELEYCKRVDWWFNNAENDEEYKEIINATFNHHSFNVKMSWDKAKIWLKRQLPDCRKTYIHKFVWNWMTKGIQMQLRREERKQ
jgi:hypothetical protein